MSTNGNMPRVRVAVDAMGGDFGPLETVPGVLAALDAHPELTVILVGDHDAVQAELSCHDLTGRAVSVVPSEGKVEDDEHPVAALRRKPKSSIVVSMGLVQQGAADMVVSMGSTGATMATAVMALGLLEGLERPCIGGNFLGVAPNTTVVDLGSNVDCRPSLLLSFAALGVAFSRRRLGIENPRVALLSVGEESSKGNRQVQESHTLFRESHLNFVGNVEGMDFFTGKADVIVCDGFIGNILIKFAEGLGSALVPYLHQRLSVVLPNEQVQQIGEALWTTMNLPRTMGGPLFGVDGLVMIGHGSSTATGVAGAINTGLLCHRLELVEGFRQELAELHRAVARET